MEGVSDKALGALGQFPIIQAAVAILILLGAVYLIFKASKDKNRMPDPIPQWVMMGPLHVMLEAVHDMAEESRRATELLKEVRDAMLSCKTALELIRNESRLR